jgi:hypothetical protein
MTDPKIIGFSEVAQIALDELFAEEKIPEALEVHIVLKEADSEEYRIHFVDRRSLIFTWRPRQDLKEIVKDAVLTKRFESARAYQWAQ